MNETDQTDCQRSSQAVAATKTAPEEVMTNQAPPPRPPEANLSSPPHVSRSASPPAQSGELESPAPAPAAPRVAKPAPRRRLLWLAGGAVVLAVAAYFLAPWVATTLNTVSTDDAYVNGHYTFVTPRVAGHVKEVLVDDNFRVKKGDLLVQLDPEPYQVKVAVTKAAVEAAQTDLTNAQSQAPRLGGARQ